ncbi:MAG: sulfur carrier protein ThiS [Candidatus Accumulibacter sp.]|uniref:sulfur carrier protein ThiS n=1 Tax=Accumulibacter sp. TaxID=2053492 RepID=UPI00287AA22A|nr:sulfur carrier protein ThiS [Accumulibacter sp.]MDS4013005.1 sulfur carrier protein ThiS [Accumulibacter sp.]
MELLINGERRQFPALLTVAELVEALHHTGKRIAVERNGEIVARGRHADTVLSDGDQIEIVVAVGGG